MMKFFRKIVPAGALFAVATFAGTGNVFGSTAGTPATGTPQAVAAKAEVFAGTRAEVGADALSLLAEPSRADGRFANTRAVVQKLMERCSPALAFDSRFTSEEFFAWREKVRSRLAALMSPPPEVLAAAFAGTASAKEEKAGAGATLISEEAREGFRLQKWECAPLPFCVAPFFVLVPDGVSAENPAPAVLCIPGSGQPKEALVREPAAGASRGGMAAQFARAGFVAVAVDNPCIGEASDLERATKPLNRDYDYEDSSRFLLELGWSYQGYAAFVDKCILDCVKRRPDVRAERILVSGFSLGTETLMTLGVLDSSIFAFVYNDFLCRTRERALVMSAPGSDGRRHFPNSIRHLTPAFLTQFDFPDLVAALAPRPVICTEGGMERDFRLVRRAYALAGVPAAATCLHQPKYAEAKNRLDDVPVPAGIDRDTFFRYANVDPANHYFKGEIAIPWAKKQVELADAAAATTSRE